MLQYFNPGEKCGSDTSPRCTGTHVFAGSWLMIQLDPQLLCISHPFYTSLSYYFFILFSCDWYQLAQKWKSSVLFEAPSFPCRAHSRDKCSFENLFICNLTKEPILFFYFRDGDIKTEPAWHLLQVILNQDSHQEEQNRNKSRLNK